MKVDDKKVEEAFVEYMENPAWKRYYENAPTDECRQYIKFNWYRSKFGEPKDVEEFKRLRNDYWSKLSVEDWEYIMENVGNSPFRAVCKEHISRLRNGG